MMPVRIAVLSDDRLFCEGLLGIIGAEASFITVGYEEGASLRPASHAARAHVLVVDSRMPGARGLCAARGRDGGPAVILVAAPDDESWAVESLAAGARGILTKSARTENLVKALRVVYEGQIWARREVLARWIERLGHGQGAPDPHLPEAGVARSGRAGGRLPWPRRCQSRPSPGDGGTTKGVARGERSPEE